MQAPRALFHSSIAPFLVLAIGATPGLSQATWTKQAPIPTGDLLYAVAMVSDNEIWAVGTGGLVFHTTNAGQSWEATQLNTISLESLFFIDSQRGWTAGNGIFHTTNGGQSWVQDSAWGAIADLFFLDALRGWGCGNGGNTFRTTNGGLSWTYQPVGTITSLTSIWFVDAQNGWTVNLDGQIYRSADGGQSWTLHFDANEYLSTLQFFDAQEGWAIGGDTFLHTTDGGQNWLPAPVPPGTWSHGARFADRTNGISVGEYGNITTTDDGGQSWKTVSPIGSGPRLWDVESWNAQTSAYCGETGGMALSTNGGSTWTSIQSGGAGYTHAIDAVDALHAWAANDGGEVLRTVDGGGFWQRIAVTGFDNYGSIADIDFFDASLGWAVGRHEFFGPGIGRIVRSTDGGLHWTLQYSATGAYMNGLEVIDTQRVLAIGYFPGGSRFILRTTNGGQSWTDVAPSQALFMDADFVDASTGWVVGGQIYKSTNGGQSWVLQYTPSQLLYRVSFADALTGWAVGWGPTVLRTTDGGQQWVPQNIGAPTGTNVIFDVRAVSSSIAWIAGESGFVARTQNGGQSWQQESVPGAGTTRFEAVCFLDTDLGWVGGKGIWRRSTPCSSPLLYCGAKPNSQGGQASIGWEGTPSLVAGYFAVDVANALPNRPGLFYFGEKGPAATPFQGGTLCVQPPLTRLPILTLNSFGAGVQPVAISPAMVGTTRWFQFWHRDPQHPDGTNVAMSNAMRVEFCD